MWRRKARSGPVEEVAGDTAADQADEEPAPATTRVENPQLVVRAPRASELRGLADVENSGIGLYTDHLGHDKVGDALRSPAPSGQQRVSVPGFLLVIGVPVVGFVHVIFLDGYAHLEQVSVRPEQMRQKMGTALVRAAMREAERDGYTQLSLCTYRDLPWNGPFCARMGFTESSNTALLHFQRRLRDFEISLGLDESGTRVVMSVPLRPERARPPGITFEPEQRNPFEVQMTPPTDGVLGATPPAESPAPPPVAGE